MEKTALVLAGGGCRGSYQIGVWQALNELDIPIDIVTGTSVGALNAALVSMGDFELAVNMWKDLRTSMILSIDVDEEQPLQQVQKAVARQFFNDYVKNGGTDSYPLKQLIDKVVDESRIRESGVACGLVAVDKATLKPIELYADEIDAGLLNDYLLASSSLFPAMRSCKIGENDYIDGAYYDNLPVELALKRGATRIIAVDLEAIGVKRTGILKSTPNVQTVKCYWNLGSLLVFDRDTIRRNIRLGYLDTMKAHDVFSGVAYTFIRHAILDFARSKRDVLRFYNETLNLTYGNSGSIRHDNLFSLKLENHIKAKYGCSVNRRYSVFLTACMETAGEIFGLDPTIIYSFDSFSAALLKQVNALEVPNIQPIGTGSFKSTLLMLDRKIRTVYLAYNIKNALHEHRKIDTFHLALFLPDEFLAAYFLAMLD